jgi:hypothetical protein
MGIVIVAGALANKCRNGGGAWERMSWVTGLRQLGCDVYFIEQIVPELCVDVRGAPASFTESANLDWFRTVTKWFGVADRAALVYAGGAECAGVPWTRLLEVARSADLLVNLSGHLTLAPLLERMRRKAYIDVDPGFTQFWHADQRTPFQVGGHDFYFTIGENIGTHDCAIPTCGILWRPIRQPVVLKDWPVTAARERDRFSTVASWRGAFGPVQCDGRTYGLKVHEFRKYFALPRLVACSRASRSTFEIALDIGAGDERDRGALRETGWLITNPAEIAGDPAAFRHYIQESGAEFSVAQGIYAETNSGWFSDRTVRYLACGKPALVQETGFSRNIPAGRGLVPFRTLEEAVCGAESIAADYAAHCRAAREIAEQYFDSDRVLQRLLEESGVAP